MAASPSTATRTRTRTDAVLTSETAVVLARAAAVEESRDPWQPAPSGADDTTVGEHLGAVVDGDRLLTHLFATTDPAYRGWRWAVTLSRVPRARSATVSEVALLPGEGALLSPDWVPYTERLAPGDLGPGDNTPYDADDQRLEPGFEATGEQDVDAMAQWELGLGRPRVLSAEGRDAAAQRWYHGEHGPRATVATGAEASCTTCGFFLPMAGELRRTFGVCTNAWSPSDGRVVSLDHGCGAHSETDERKPEPERVDPPVLDELGYEEISRD